MPKKFEWKFRAVKCAILFWAVAVSSPSLAQQATFRDPLLDHLAGRWILKGDIAGRQIVHDVSATWVLNHQYLEFQEVSRDKGKDGNPAYTATVYIGWDQRTAHYVCVWLDDYGDISSQSLGQAPRAADRIAFVFHDLKDTGSFHTTFSHGATGNWTMNMDQETGGKLSPFARTVLTRAE